MFMEGIMELVTASRIMYIKLGKGDSFAEECITHNILKLDYREVDHRQCINGDWNLIEKFYRRGKSKPAIIATAKRHIKQLKYFYESDSDVLWITFYDNKMWWCKTDKQITLELDHTKTKKTVNGWRDTDILGSYLFKSKISGKILTKPAYPGTICEFNTDDQAYILRKINGQKTETCLLAEKSRNSLISSLIPLIQSLTWKDFELLVDIILRQAGWLRVSPNGEQQKTLDLDLIQPITNKRAWVQVKSKSSKKTYCEYANTDFDGYDYFFFFVHSPLKSLRELKIEDLPNGKQIFFAEDIAMLIVSSGLVDWIIERTS